MLVRLSVADDKKPIWNRLPGQANRIPNKLKLILPTGRKGCSLARFSPDGRYGKIDLIYEFIDIINEQSSE